MSSRLFKLSPAILIIVAAISVLSFTDKKGKTSHKKEVVFFDDFSGKSVDRSKWNIIVTDKGVVNNEQQAYVDSSATLYIAHGAEAEGAHNGALVIRPVYSPGFTNQSGHKFDFLSGRMDSRSKVEFTYGRLEARMKMPAGEGFWPAFWALGEGNWPDCGEIDVMETVGDPTWVSAAMHGPGYYGNTPIVKRDTLKNDVTQWHVYSADWTPDQIVFKVDDVPFYTVTKAMVEKYGRWAYDNPKFLIVNFAIGGVYPNNVNKIAQPYFGLSQSSVDKIKAGKAKVLVDWIRVTKL